MMMKGEEPKEESKYIPITEDECLKFQVKYTLNGEEVYVLDIQNCSWL